jgi:hypothetical protein
LIFVAQFRESNRDSQKIGFRKLIHSAGPRSD